MDCLSSMYIDNEMRLDEKKIFIDKIRNNPDFYELTRQLLEQEQLIEAQAFLFKSVGKEKSPCPVRDKIKSYFKPLGFGLAGFTVSAMLFLFLFKAADVPENHRRFVLFEPTAEKVDIVGSFTGWQRVSLQPIGGNGYWELVLPIKSGEHRFSYILDGKSQIADPTLPTREKDDYGGENSIFTVVESI